jgi:hypothetical protein
MNYVTLADVKNYLGITTADDDAVLSRLIGAAQGFIESYTGRRFEPYEATIVHDGTDVVDDMLVLRDDLLNLSVVTINGVAVDVSGIQLLGGLRGEPYYALRAMAFFACRDDAVINVTGQWGYSTNVPSDIVHACTRLVGYFYRQRDAQVFDTTALPSAGVITVPRGIPADVQRILDHYRRPV